MRETILDTSLESVVDEPKATTSLNAGDLLRVA